MKFETDEEFYKRLGIDHDSQECEDRYMAWSAKVREQLPMDIFKSGNDLTSYTPKNKKVIYIGLEIYKPGLEVLEDYEYE